LDRPNFTVPEVSALFGSVSNGSWIRVIERSQIPDAHDSCNTHSTYPIEQLPTSRPYRKGSCSYVKVRGNGNIESTTLHYRCPNLSEIYTAPHL